MPRPYVWPANVRDLEVMGIRRSMRTTRSISINELGTNTASVVWTATQFSSGGGVLQCTTTASLYCFEQ